MNTELLEKIIKEMIGTDFTYTSYVEQKEKTVHVKNKDTAVEILRDALGYEEKTSIYKVFSGETKCPRKEKMEILQKMFGVSFYLEKVGVNQKGKEEIVMLLNDISKKTLIDMYAATIKFFNSTVDCVEEIDELLQELDQYRLGIPIEVFDIYTKHLKELVYNLPAVDCSDIIEKENIIPDENSLDLLLLRYLERTLSAKHQFIDLAQNEFASLVQR